MCFYLLRMRMRFSLAMLTTENAINNFASENRGHYSTKRVRMRSFTVASENAHSST